MPTHGSGPGGTPFHRFGSGSQPLFLLPGVMDALSWNTPRRLARELLARHYFRSFRDYDVWAISRPPGLSPDETIEEMASRYLPLLEQYGGGHVMGLTLGGALGTYLAAEYPRLVDRLVLVGCGTTLGKRGQRIIRRWRAIAKEGDWGSLHADYAKQMYTGTYRRILTTLYRLCHSLLPRPECGADVVRSCQALLGYDGKRILETIDAPTLVVADTDGPLFPLSEQRDAARRVRRGHIATIPGSHAVYEQSRRTFGDVVRRFLAGQHTG
jgi:3-oxoadipate enol-lactonase/4-carboxymuconolactone decarboxylase